MNQYYCKTEIDKKPSIISQNIRYYYFLVSFLLIQATNDILLL